MNSIVRISRILLLSHRLLSILSDVNGTLMKTVKIQNISSNYLPIVDTLTGKLRGKILKTNQEQKNYFAFTAIPYAEPPLNDLRFKAPKPKRPWNGTLNATKKSPMCMQGLVIPHGSEDCLYLNVFTPMIGKGINLSVMVWIYGGFFIHGNDRMSKFGPDYLIDEGVVVVAMNYRTGIFGFLSTFDDAADGNYGIKDQLLALQWIKSNIANFGGDPNSVTVFGESAGAACISYLLQTPVAKGLFHKAIMQSGISLMPWDLSIGVKKSAFNAGAFSLIFTKNSSTLITKLKTVNAHWLQFTSGIVFIIRSLFSNSVNGLIFGPSEEYDHPGAVIRGRSHQKISEGNFTHIPIIIGYNSNEGAPFGLDFARFGRLYLLQYDIDKNKLIPEDMNINNSYILRKLGHLVKQRYFGSLPVALASKSAMARFVSAIEFEKCVNEYVKLYSGKAPCYFYRFSYEGKLGRPHRQVAGVGHGEDLHYIWRQESSTDHPNTEDLIIRRRMVKLWTNFAKFRNPTPSRDEFLQNTIWPTSNPKNYSFLNIDEKLTVQTNPNYGEVKFWNTLYKKYGNPPYDTY